MTKRIFRSALALLVTVTVLFGSASVALAKGPSKSNGHASRFASQFDDWDPNYWANESLARMIVKGVIKGATTNYGLDVQPNKPVTRLEAAVMLVRLLGLDKEQPAQLWDQPFEPGHQYRFRTGSGLNLEAEMEDGQLQYKFDFEDDDAIPLWGRDAVAIALEKGFLVFEGRSLNPLAPLKRVEAAIMLVKAAGLEDQALAQAGAALPFKDSAAISYAAKGYVAVALKEGLIYGNPDGTFQPNKPVTRAQWAAMLDRFDRGSSNDSNQIKGVITAINQVGTALPTISMTTPVFPGGVTYTVADQAAFFVNGQEADISALHVGDQVLVQLSDTRQITMITVVNGSQQSGVTGVVAAFTAPTATQNGTIILQAATGAGQAYAVASTAMVRLGVTTGTFADVRQGDSVTLTVQNGVVQVITVNVTTQTVQGTVAGKTIGASGQPSTLTVNTSAGATTTYTLDSNVTIVSAAGSNLTLADISVGDQVQLQVQRSLVVRISILQSTSTQTVTGSLSALTIGSAAVPSTLTVTTSAGARSFPIAANASVTYGTQSLTLGDLRLGDALTLTVQNGVVTAIAVGQRANDAVVVTGTVSNLATLNSSFTLTASGSTYTVLWNTSTTFTNQTQPATAASLANSQQVKVTGKLLGTTLLAAAIDIQVAQTTVNGVITNLVDNSGATPDVLAINTGNAAAMYQVASTVRITWNGVTLSFANLLVGDSVTLTLTNGVVSAIDVTGRQTQAVSLSGAVSGVNATNHSFVLTVPGTPTSAAYTVGWGSQTVFTYQGLNVTDSQLANGQQVTVTGQAAGTLVTAARVDIQVNQANLTGSVTSLTAPSGTTPGAITIQSSSATSSYQVLATVKVTWKGLPITFADLAVGDGVTLTLTNGVVSAIDLTTRQAAAANLTGILSGLNTQATTFVLTVLTLDASGQTTSQTYTIGYSDQTTITYLGLTVSTASLANGQSVVITGGQVGQAVSASRIDIQQLAQ